jgi:hypothetical protein
VVQLTALHREDVLRALDETPQTVDRLARRLDADPDDVQAVLERAAEESEAVDWGHVWATTWRAKLTLAPRFFKIWIPGSVALGATLTGTALALNGPQPIRWEASISLLVVAAAAAVLAALPAIAD